MTITRATLQAMQGDPRGALLTLGPDPSDAPSRFLMAMCLRSTGERLRAAATFQDIADRSPNSPLRDPALLAKADVFLEAGDFRSASEAFDRVARRVHTPSVLAEAELRAAGSRFLAGDADTALARLQGLLLRYDGTDVAARGQFLIGEVLVSWVGRKKRSWNTTGS